MQELNPNLLDQSLPTYLILCVFKPWLKTKWKILWQYNLQKIGFDCHFRI